MERTVADEFPIRPLLESECRVFLDFLEKQQDSLWKNHVDCQRSEAHRYDGLAYTFKMEWKQTKYIYDVFVRILREGVQARQRA